MPTALLENLLELSRFSGDSAAALEALSQHFAHLLPGCHIALMLVRDQPAGSARLAGLIGADGTEHLPNHDPLNERGQLARFDDALCRTLFGWTVPQIVNVSVQERGTPLAQALFAPASIFATPIVNAGAVSHWLLFASAVSERFDHVDIEQLVVRANLAANLVIRQVIFTSMAAEATRQRAEIEGLADVQKLLLPDSPRIRGLAYSVHWQPADTAAGDYYDLSNLSWFADPPLAPDSHDLWALMLADVSGHGAAAAMEGAQFDAILRTYRGDEPPLGPAGALTYANRYFFSRRQRRHFLTAFAILYDPRENLMSYVCAGHSPALLCRGSERRWLGLDNDAGIPLGILREHRWENVKLSLEPGDTLLLYTDGIVEARNAEGEMFGQERLAQGMADAVEMQLDALRDRLVHAVQTHQGGVFGTDDQTLILLRLGV
jgi:sigma-B regulation protein RsbU (phosphoserine phosphatase)